MKDKIKRNIYILVLSILLFIVSICIQSPTWNKHNETVENKVENVIEVVETEKEEQEENNNIVEVQENTTIEEVSPANEPNWENISQDYQGGFTGYLTHYGPDCAGCGGVTASGYDVRNTIYYEDDECGTLRIVALSSSYPLYTVIKISNYRGGEIYAIVLDRGGAITGDKVDLLVSSEAEAAQLGTQSNVVVNIMRWGKGN